MMTRSIFLRQIFFKLVVLCLCAYLSNGISRTSGYSPTNRRKLSSLIVTRDRIPRPPLYGAHGSTAAEFVVSAGLDTSQTAVRIRRVRETNMNSSFINIGDQISNNSEAAAIYSKPRMQQRLQRQFRHQISTSDINDGSRTYDSTAALLAEVPSFKDVLLNLTGPLLRYLLRSSSPNDVLERSSPDVLHHKFERIHRNKNYSTAYSRNDLTTHSSLASDSSMRSKLSNVTVPLLRHLVASHLLEGVLNLRNISANIMNNATSSPYSSLDNSYTVSSSPPETSESLTRSEQFQHGVMMNPYYPLQYSYLQKSVKPILAPTTVAPRVPVYRVLKGKLVPVPQLPSELIPLVLGNYQQTTPTNDDDDVKFTENILDSVIYALLQSDDLLKLVSLIPSSNALNTDNALENRKMHPTSQPAPIKTLESYINPSREPRCDRLTEEICLEDADYPSSAIMSSIYKDKNKFDLMYAEIKERESQVDGLSRIQEQAYNYEHYYGSASTSGGLRPRDYSAHGGFVCPSEVHYGRPHKAKNRKGEWKVVVNVAEYTQTIRMEKCLSANLPCKYVVNKIHSTCSQVYSYHRLLVFNKEHGLHIDAFRMPTGCTCHIRGHRYMFPQPIRNHEEFGGHVESAPQPQIVQEGTQQQKKNGFGSTLWAILGGGKQAGSLSQNSQFLDEVQKHISWTQNLKPFPQFLQHVSPSQVLKQLLEDEDDTRSIRRQPLRHRPPSAMDKHPPYPSHHLPIVVRAPSMRDQTSILRKQPQSLPRRPVSVEYKQTYIGVPLRAAANSVPIMVKPGMYFASEEVSKPEIKSTTGSQFSDTTEEDTGFKPIVKPAKELPPPPPPLRPPPTPASKDEAKEEEDGDLLALEKAEPTPNLFNLDSLSSSGSKDSSEETETKINFSYHPILEYLSLS